MKEAGVSELPFQDLKRWLEPGADSSADANAKALFNLFEIQFRSRGLAPNQARMPSSELDSTIYVDAIQ